MKIKKEVKFINLGNSLNLYIKDDGDGFTHVFIKRNSLVIVSSRIKTKHVFKSVLKYLESFNK